MANSLSASSVNSYVAQEVAALGDKASAYAGDVKDFVTSVLALDNIEINAPWVDPTIGYEISQAANNLAPVEAKIDYYTPAEPIEPSFTNIYVPGFGNIPELNLAEPIINLPTAPDSSLPTSPGAAPDFTSPALPSTPTVTLPTPPTFQNVAIPAVPAYSIPAYTPVFPADDITDPTASFNYVEQEYQSVILDELKAKLLTDLTNGGYGIETADEQGLWERAREREVLAGEASIQETIRQQAARGFMMPPGAAQAMVESAQQNAMMKISSLNREIALKRADLYVENRKFTIQEVQKLEQMLITYFGYKMERALNVAKYSAEFSIQIFNALVARYNARMEAVKTGAHIYDTQLKSALAHLEAYKTEVEALSLSVDVQKLYADVYRTQLEGVKTYVDVYRTQMEAVKVQAEVEKLKLDAFRSKVDAYTAQVGAKNAEFQMFKAQIDGEMSKVEIYKASADAYGTRVQAYATKANATKIEVDAQISVEELKLNRYKTQVGMYEAKLNKLQTDVKAQLDLYGANLQKYRVGVDAQVSSVNTITEATKANAQVALSKAQVASSHIMGTAQVEDRHNQSGAMLSAHMFQTYNAMAQAIAGMSGSTAIELSST